MRALDIVLDVLRAAGLRIRALVRRDRVWHELDDEIRFHIEMETERYVRVGHDLRSARRMALRRFGGVERYKEQSREAWGTLVVEETMQDIKYGLRMLRKYPVFSGVAVLTLALGIGAVTALYSVVDSVLLEPLPFDEPDELVLLWTENQAEGQSRYFVSPQDFGDWREMNRTFEGMAAFWPTPVALTELAGDPLRVSAVFTTENYFTVLGAEPILGRAFGPGDGPGSQQVVILSQGLWERAFGADPGVVGSTVVLDGQALEIIGVMGMRQTYPESAELWTNMTWPMTIQSRIARWMSAIGRLGDGVPIERAREDMATIALRLGETHPHDTGWGVTMAPLEDEIIGDARSALWVLLGATGFILLIACANVANLLLSKAEVRSREVAVRRAFGAGRGRIARQLFTESLVLAGFGAAAGLGLAWAGVRALRAVGPSMVPRVADVQVDGTVLLIVTAASVVTGLLFGLAPVLRILGDDTYGAIREGSRGTRGVRKARLQSSFVMTQLALAAVLAIGAGLLVRSFGELRAVDTGFSAGGRLSFELDLNQVVAQDDQAVIRFYQEFVERLAAAPGVSTVGMASTLPLGGEVLDYNQPFQIIDRDSGGDETRAFYRHVSPDFFAAMGTPLVSGRGLEATDILDAPGAVVINEAMARRYWPGEDPVGDRVTAIRYRWGPLGAVLLDEAEIVGVVKDIKYDGLREGTAPAMYFSYLQAPMRRMTVVVRSAGDPATLLPVARSELAAIDPTLPVSNVRTLDEVMDRATATERFSMTLLGLLGGLALTLAAIGVYGVLSYAVEQRVPEVGIRMALGATAREVSGLILRDGLRVIVPGLALGVVVALLLAGVLSGQLFGVSPRDPKVIGGVVAVLATVAVAASWIPARRATRVDPVVAMRNE